MTNAVDDSWVLSLAQRYELATQHNKQPVEELLKQLPSLQFASSELKKKQLEKKLTDRSTHIVVMGPTQSGKSTLVNVLLDCSAAAVSALAGHTVHAQGYARHLDNNDIALVDELLAPMQRTPGRSLDSNNLDCYVLETIANDTRPLVDNAVVWDTPDFDSITAATYSTAVIRAAALADVIVLTMSKDKYGDKRVWDMLDLLHAMGKPLLLCINKVSDADRQVISNAFSKRFADVFGTPMPQMIMLPFVERDENKTTLALDNNTRQHLKEAVQNVRTMLDKTTNSIHYARFVDRYQAQWLDPLIAEMDAREQWLQLTRHSIDDADQYYLSNYLNSSDKYETFNRALAELLTLLEIPGVAATIARARQTITWPARRLLGIGRGVFGKQADHARDASGQVMDHEALVLQHILDSTVIRLQRELLEAPAQIWWQDLDATLRQQLPAMRLRFNQASEQARHEFEPEIEKAAASLYEQLQTQPTLLNTLRAARASADAAGIALAVKTGGLAPADLILAPAMLAVTTLLTESALGRYLDSVKNDLKQRQRQHIRKTLFEDVLLVSMMDLLEQLDRPELLTTDLEPALLTRLDAYRLESVSTSA